MHIHIQSYLNSKIAAIVTVKHTIDIPQPMQLTTRSEERSFNKRQIAIQLANTKKLHTSASSALTKIQKLVKCVVLHVTCKVASLSCIIPSVDQPPTLWLLYKLMIISRVHSIKRGGRVPNSLYAPYKNTAQSIFCKLLITTGFNSHVVEMTGRVDCYRQG